jgi:uncharacterized protein YndB with AHSA1/START domain
MRTAFEDRTVISADRTAVWAALTDWQRAGRWMPGVDGMTLDGPLRVGGRLRYRARGKERSSQIVAVDQGRSISLESRQGGVRSVYDYRLDDGPDGSLETVVSLAAGVETSGPMRLLGPTIRSAIAKEDGAQLARLKAWIEGG